MNPDGLKQTVGYQGQEPILALHYYGCSKHFLQEDTPRKGQFSTMILPWLLVLVFIIHDGEEVLLLPRWVQRNSSLFEKLEDRYPSIRRFIHLLRENNQRQFTISVLFLLCVIATSTWMLVLQPSTFVFQFVFIGITSVFTLHLLVHIFQSIIIRRIVPGTITSVLVFLPSLFLWKNQVIISNLTPIQSLLIVLASLVTFLPVFVFALRFGNWAGKSKPGSSRN
jgi:hypothetical protein